MGDAHIQTARSETIGELIASRYNRRRVLQSALAGVALAGAGGVLWPDALAAQQPAAGSSLLFNELPHGADGGLRVANGYDAQVVIRWGDPIFADAPIFDPLNQTATRQQRQFGYNNDFVAFMPLPPGSKNASHGLL